MTVQTEKQVEFKMNAFVLMGLKKQEKVPLPAGFLSHLIGMPFDQRWDNKEPKPGSICKNMAFFQQVSPSEVAGATVYDGTLVEVSFQESMDLFGWDGAEASHPLPPEKGPREFWHLAISPSHNLLVMEGGRSPEKKLHNYLSYICTQIYNRAVGKDERLDGISIEAVPVESNPVGYLRDNPNLGSFEAVINAREFTKHNYGPLGSILGGLSPEDERLVMKITISSQRRGKDLPLALVSNIATFLESIDPSDLNQARVSEYESGKRLRPTKLLGAFHHKQLWIEDEDESKKEAIINYLNDLMEIVGDD